MTNTNQTHVENRELPQAINVFVNRLDGDIGDLSSTLVYYLIMDGCRMTRVGDNCYLIDESGAIDANADDEVITYLDTKYGDEDVIPSSVFSLIWDFTYATIAERVMDIRDLVKLAGVDPAVWLPDCPTPQTERALITRMYHELGKNFFQVQPQYREEYEDCIQPLETCISGDLQ